MKRHRSFMSLKDPSKFFFAFLCCFCLGIFLGVYFSLSIFFFLYAFIGTLFAFGVSVYTKQTHSFLFSLLVFFSIILGGLRLQMSLSSENTHIPNGVVTGVVVSNPSDKSYGQSFIFRTNHNEKLLVKNSSASHVTYNDTLEIDVTCTTPKNFETDLGSTFDYVTYLKKDHMYATCETKHVTFISHTKSPLQTLYRFSNFIGDQISDVFKSPHNAFIGGVLVGDKTNISNDIRNDFIKTGTIHILALSGYNIAIIALFFQYIFIRLFRKKVALTFSGISVLLFVAMTGFMASAIRAGLMAIIVIFAQFTYQKYSALRALLFVSFVMVLFDPFYLLYDSSFHLSFLATFGVVVVSPLIHVYLHRIPNNTFRGIVSTTLGAYLMTFPYLMYFFQGLSLVGIFANILILPFIPLLMLMSTGTLLISFISFPLSFVPSVLTDYLSQGILSLIHLCAQVPFGYVSTSISQWVCVGLYVGIFYMMYRLQKKVDLRD